jgi:hypothetical protein
MFYTVCVPVTWHNATHHVAFQPGLFSWWMDSTYSWTSWCWPSIASVKATISTLTTLVLAKLAGYIDYVVKEAFDICLHPGILNRDTRFTLSLSWHPDTNIPTKWGQQTAKGSTTEQNFQGKQHSLCDDCCDWPPDFFHCSCLLTCIQGCRAPTLSHRYKLQ